MPEGPSIFILKELITPIFKGKNNRSFWERQN